ncbi:MAG TPA: nitrate reductase molybdenum cofactor assembly chaperone [Chitinolyticbacter sp.]|uniref:nitrate reductase molybdenum cofactor assembly chaperone n=1 Tax=Chitinolyticbacter albus TaxID=2961951 RepID=UPI002109C613|nr:nitrate reductase molybdenum cofactor assembly chaperone [Chitinolyticbacter albus]HSC80930.1 nitrate reductase molybdenum cofactor assembly chaperone [Chitinolyticbacter sp.]
MNTLCLALSALLSYPEAELVAAIDEIDAALASQADNRARLWPLLDFLRSNSLIALQENYVATFDRNPAYALHLFEHLHGESRDRGEAMVDLLNEYQRHGFEPGSETGELPDYLPLFLEFLGQLPAEQALPLLNEAVHVIAAIGDRLAESGSPYATIFAVLRELATVAPKPLREPPVRDMDELLETFGPGADGAEPLLRPQPGGVQTVQFHRKAPLREEGATRP